MSTEIVKDLNALKYLAPSSNWPKKLGFSCSHCGEPIRYNPHIPEILGCAKCATTVRPNGYEKCIKAVQKKLTNKKKLVSEKST